MTIWLFYVQRMEPDWFINGIGQHGVLNSQPRHFSLNTSLSEQFSTMLHQPSHSWIHSKFCSADVLPPWQISWIDLTICQLYIWEWNWPSILLIAYWMSQTVKNIIHKTEQFWEFYLPDSISCFLFIFFKFFFNLSPNIWPVIVIHMCRIQPI